MNNTNDNTIYKLPCKFVILEIIKFIVKSIIVGASYGVATILTINFLNKISDKDTEEISKESIK